MAGHHWKINNLRENALIFKFSIYSLRNCMDISLEDL